MKRLGGSAAAAVVTAALGLSVLGAPASGSRAAASGDTCTATGNGTSYTLNITIPATAPPQYGFAFGAGSANVTNAVMAGPGGTFATTNMPPGATGAWISTSPIASGTASATVTVTKPVTGSFSVAPAASSTMPSTYLDAFSCALVTSGRLPTASLTLKKPAVYVPALRGWRLGVKIPSAGVVSARQLEPSKGTATSKAVTPKPLVHVRSAGLRSAGIVNLHLMPTAAGRAALSARGAINVQLQIAFARAGKQSGIRVVSLTLRK